MNSRITVFVWVICALLVLLTARVFHLQVLTGSKWQALALANKEFANRTPRKRALITDRFARPLVMNDWLYYKLDDQAALFGTSTLITPQEGKALLATDSASLLPVSKRWYPLGQVLAPVIGYVGSVTAENLQSDADLSPIDQVGKQGLEATYDPQLRGGAGKETYEISALGAKQRLLRSTPAGGGMPIQTTLDPYLSAVAYRALGDNKGAVVITDIKTGEILSLVSTPAFDPNTLTDKQADPDAETARKAAIQSQLTDANQLFFNRAVGGAYPPGSIFKLVTALAALDSGKITPETEVLDEGVLRVGEFSYANWYYTQYGGTEGLIALQRAIARSNDIYFYKAAEAAGPDAIARMARQIGFGQPLDIGLPGEVAGLVPDPQWKESTRGERWFLGNTYHYGIGQGDLLVTPVQSAQMIQTLLNGGVRCDLHLIAGEARNCQNLGFNEADLQLVLAGMEDACTTGGTAFPFFAWNAQVRQEGLSFKEQLMNGAVACKTGTAEFGGTDSQGYKKTHGWFVMGVGIGSLLDKQLAVLKDDSQNPTASVSATRVEVALDDSVLASSSAAIERFWDKQAWLRQVAEHGYPDGITITVLVESDEQRPYREGSRDGGPIAKEIVDWLSDQ